MESTLTATYFELLGEAGFYLGYGRGEDNGELAWTDTQAERIGMCLKSALARFYFPDLSPTSGAVSHSWTFLKPIGTVTILQGNRTVLMPADFAGLDGRLAVMVDGRSTAPITLIGETRLRVQISPDSTGQPWMGDLEAVKGTSPIEGQRTQLVVWPLPDQDYIIQFRYLILPEYLSGAFPYAYGGGEHSETLRAGIRAIAELMITDAQGPQELYYQQRLAVSISIDRRKQPQFLGYNSDKSDITQYTDGRGERGWFLPPVTYNGNSFD